MSFSKDFVWGVATSSYQIEGAAQEDGKGLSIWDVYSHQPGKTFEGDNGDIACDHYHRYREDIKLMAELGVKAYRFSVSWPRVLPNGTGPVNEKGIQFYSDLVDEMLKYGITPYLTLYHWDMPYELYRRGGWMNPDSPKWFAEYAALIASRLGSRVKHYMTFNEPQVFIGLAFVDGVHAPGHKYTRKETLQMAHHVLLAHGLAAQAVRSHVPGAKIGYAPTSNVPVPISDRPEDIAAARRMFFEMPEDGDWSWNTAWWSDPVLLGHYPEDGMKVLEKDLPLMGQNDMAVICQPLDFYGQNIYRGVPVRADENGRPKNVPYPQGDPKTAIGWHVNFDCLYWGTRFLYERYKTPIFITENGMSSHDWVHLDGKVHDPQRIDYLQRHLRWLKKAAEEGVEAAGYFQWSFMDNFEWARGYNDRFGIVYVDYETQKRILKDSYYWYRDVIRENGENL
ncbi:beta-glucosidase [Clostridium sp. MCC353]|uniref:GH1 family beta-glucosidase n=1 Tax=Clostridium sp. MCC353 TaxID=2592646 RepID=UPI001C029120|nr:beta-glucosidase [Clostridium sp. MCC353]